MYNRYESIYSEIGWRAGLLKHRLDICARDCTEDFLKVQQEDSPRRIRQIMNEAVKLCFEIEDISKQMSIIAPPRMAEIARKEAKRFNIYLDSVAKKTGFSVRSIDE